MLDHQKGIQEGRNREKKRIGRDLHDGVMNGLAGARINLSSLAAKTDGAHTKFICKQINNIHNIEIEIRNISHNLTSEIFKKEADFGLLLKELFASQSDVDHCKFKIVNESVVNWEFLDSTQKVNLYRVFQEILQNAAKYSMASIVKVEAQAGTNSLVIKIMDNGIGFESFPVKGFGINGIRTRLSSMRGRLELSNNNDGGATYKLLIPLKLRNY